LEYAPGGGAPGCRPIAPPADVRSYPQGSAAYTGRTAPRYQPGRLVALSRPTSGPGSGRAPSGHARSRGGRGRRPRSGGVIRTTSRRAGFSSGSQGKRKGPLLLERDLASA
jgi:hypothetical protein